MVEPEAIVKAIKDTVEVVKALESMRALIDGARSVVLEVYNHTDFTLHLDSHGHDHGGWKVPPLQQLPPKSVMVFGSRDKGFMTGTEGSVVWRGEHNGSFFVSNRWNNPFVGANGVGAWAFRYQPLPDTANEFMRRMFPKGIPAQAGDFDCSSMCGSGNTDAMMRYEIRAT